MSKADETPNTPAELLARQPAGWDRGDHDDTGAEARLEHQLGYVVLVLVLLGAWKGAEVLWWAVRRLW